MTESEKKQRVLVVDDIGQNISVVNEILKPYYTIMAALDGEKALAIAHSDRPPDLILLDVMMPEMDGYEVCQRLQSDIETHDIPIIFLSALDDTKDKVKGFEVGAVDYVSKPFQPEEVIARVKTHLTISSLKNSLAEKNEELKAVNELLEERVKERTAELVTLNEIYERFVPREFLNLLKKKSIHEINLADQIHQEMTVMFADVRGWTTLSESMSPQENFNFINAYLKRVSPVIKEHNGFIDQYYGDGVMALFPDSPDDAVLAAIAMHAAVGEYNKQREKNGFKPIGIGVGLHVGDLMLGIIGSQDRMQGAVVADDVNLAARLEGLTRMYGSTITLSETTLSRLENPDRYKHRFVDKVQVKGRKIPVSVHEVFDGDPQSVMELKEQTKGFFEEGLRLYYDKKFSESSVQFNQVLQKNPEDKAARIYLKRSADYMINGVPDDWTGVESLTKK
jgi:two-component system sensor histidine kinase ChiS